MPDLVNLVYDIIKI